MSPDWPVWRKAGTDVTDKRAASWAAPVISAAEKVFTQREVGNVNFMDTCCH